MSKGRRVVTRIAKAFVAIAIVAWLTWFVVSLSAEREFEAKVAELRRQGARVEFKDFHRTPTFDDANAATHLREALAALPEDALELPGEAYDIDLHEDSDMDIEEFWPGVEKWVDGLAPWFDVVDRAARLPRCDFGRDTSDWFETSAEHWKISRQISETHAWAIRVLERRGGPAEDAVRMCETLMLWGRKHPPDLLIGYFTTNASDEYLYESIKRVVRLPGVNIASVRALLDSHLAAAEDDEERLRQALDGAFASFLEVARIRTTWTGARRLSGMAFFEPEASTLVRTHMLFRRDRLWRGATRAIEQWQHARSLLENDRPHTWKELKQYWISSPHEEWLPGYLRVDFQAHLAGVQKSRVRHRAQLRIARLGLAALEFHNARGRWPKRPADLEPILPTGVPADPGTGKPFAFEIDGGSTAHRVPCALARLVSRRLRGGGANLLGSPPPAPPQVTCGTGSASRGHRIPPCSSVRTPFSKSSDPERWGRCTVPRATPATKSRSRSSTRTC